MRCESAHRALIGVVTRGVLLAAVAAPGIAAAAPARPVHTYSIVARDPNTGEIGVAVQSHWFSVGPLVPWAEAGVGAVATQSFVDVSYGPLGLELMRGGFSAPEALARLLADDPEREVRQVAMVDAQGRIAVHTGKLCIWAAGHEIGEQFSTQANLMANERVWGEMAGGFRRAAGSLGERLLAALDAAQRAGGDVRGRQSAAVLVVSGEPADEVWKGKVLDLRVEDHPEPLVELRRLAHLHRAYGLANLGDEMVAAGRFEEALSAYGAASGLAPENAELRFWQAASLYKLGDKERALEAFRQVFAAAPQWAVVLARLEKLELIAPAGTRYETAVRDILTVAPDEARESGLAELGRMKGRR
jgi:uncharacterized Ntn-hydrolase superfamily protein